MQFAADLVRATAWPVVTLVIVLILRKPLAEVLRTRLKKLKGPGFEAELFDAVADRFVRPEVEQAKAESQQLDAGHRPTRAAIVDPELLELVTAAPDAAIVGAYDAVRDDLRERLIADGMPASELPNDASAGHLATLAVDRGVITDASENAVQGLTALRNLATTTHRDVTPTQAVDYIHMANAVLYSFRKPGRKP